MLEIRNLNKNFDGVHAVQDFSLSLHPRNINSLIGPNGAGKTTVFNVVTGFLSASSGEVSFNGRSVNGLATWRIARQGISRTFQNLRLFKKLTVLENVLLGRQGQAGEGFINALFKFSESSQEHQIHLTEARGLLDFVGLADHQDNLAENLSYGQQKLLSIACCLTAEPELLLLDEPVSGVQPAMIQNIESILKHLVTERGKTVWLIEHDIDFVLRISDVVVVMDEGRKIAEDTPAVIQNSPQILEAYLS
jgi:ABC-type branched-subunit amino acid transport system ATPase component